MLRCSVTSFTVRLICEAISFEFISFLGSLKGAREGSNSTYFGDHFDE
jgi:hypothetical protein